MLAVSNKQINNILANRTVSVNGLICTSSYFKSKNINLVY